jgi:hypothetical protein
MDKLTLFGLVAVTAMLVCYALEPRGRGFILAFAGACLLGSVYGFLQGAWPFGVVEAVWAGIAVRKWWRAAHSNPLQPNAGDTPPGPDET